MPTVPIARVYCDNGVSAAEGELVFVIDRDAGVVDTNGVVLPFKTRRTGTGLADDGGFEYELLDRPKNIDGAFVIRVLPRGTYRFKSTAGRGKLATRARQCLAQARFEQWESARMAEAEAAEAGQ